ncbi:hypothetical protein CBR_g4736 [Chara braunii]|uniref:Uncharacterized protein n=1 Tax=Chara braunii TaxID=69332 RepID=A0A388KIP8_CHABU|nr:hypothetical protein CBR_g4736 [Chara braunii]|eukprot:GBG69909.1 hypothetical protein CBR_g4736 [Chara braunii]
MEEGDGDREECIAEEAIGGEFEDGERMMDNSPSASTRVVGGGIGVAGKMKLKSSVDDKSPRVLSSFFSSQITGRGCKSLRNLPRDVYRRLQSGSNGMAALCIDLETHLSSNDVESCRTVLRTISRQINELTSIHHQANRESFVLFGGDALLLRVLNSPFANNAVGGRSKIGVGAQLASQSTRVGLAGILATSSSTTSGAATVGGGGGGGAGGGGAGGVVGTLPAGGGRRRPRLIDSDRMWTAAARLQRAGNENGGNDERGNQREREEEEVLPAPVWFLRNECLAILRDLCFTSPYFPESLAQHRDFLRRLFILMGNKETFDNAVALAEEILAAREETLNLQTITGFADLVRSFSSQQLAFFCRVLAMVVFEPEDRSPELALPTTRGQDTGTLEQIHFPKFAKEADREPSVVDTNHEVLMSIPELLPRLVKLLQVKKVHYGGQNPLFTDWQVRFDVDVAEWQPLLGSQRRDRDEWGELELDGSEELQTVRVPPVMEDASAGTAPRGQWMGGDFSLDAVLRNREHGTGRNGNEPVVSGADERRGAVNVRADSQSTDGASPDRAARPGREHGVGMDDGNGAVRHEFARGGAATGMGARGPLEAMGGTRLQPMAQLGGGEGNGVWELPHWMQMVHGMVVLTGEGGGAFGPGTAALGAGLGHGLAAVVERRGMSIKALQFASVEVLFVLCALLGGKKKELVQDRLAELGLVPILTKWFDKLDWKAPTPPPPEPHGIHGPGCACNPQSALKIQYLRLVHNFCDRDSCNRANKQLLLQPVKGSSKGTRRENRDGDADHLDVNQRPKGKGLMSKIIDVLMQEPADSVYRFWLASCVEAFLRGSDPRDQEFVQSMGLMEHLVGEILKGGFKCAASLQINFDLLGELVKFNPAMFVPLNKLLVGDKFDRLVEVVVTHLVDSNVFIRSVLLSLESFCSGTPTPPYAGPSPPHPNKTSRYLRGQPTLLRDSKPFMFRQNAQDWAGGEQKAMLDAEDLRGLGREIERSFRMMRSSSSPHLSSSGWERGGGTASTGGQVSFGGLPLPSPVQSWMLLALPSPPTSCQMLPSSAMRMRMSSGGKWGVAMGLSQVESCKLSMFMAANAMRLLHDLMCAVRLDDVNQDNICVLNTALIFLIFAERNGVLGAYLQQLRCSDMGLGWAAPGGMSSGGLEKSPFMGPGSVTRNFRALLDFWQEYYLKRRGKDCVSLEYSTNIPFSEWLQMVELLCSGPECSMSLVYSPGLQCPSLTATSDLPPRRC